MRGRQRKAVWSPGGRGFPDSGQGPGRPPPAAALSRAPLGARPEASWPAVGDTDRSRVASAWPWHISALLSWIPRTAPPLQCPWRGQGLGGAGCSGRGGSPGLCQFYERRDCVDTRGVAEPSGSPASAGRWGSRHPATPGSQRLTRPHCPHLGSSLHPTFSYGANARHL